uniref:Uncharacterized protein n=1 Tax=Ursus americanus TaxID=9643 RepID=A0A452SU56_URSAM
WLDTRTCGIMSINQYIAEMVWHMPDTHQRSIHAVLEILSQERPCDAGRTPSCARRGNGFFQKHVVLPPKNSV